MGDRRLGVAVLCLCLLAIICGLALGVERRNVSRRRSFLPGLDKRKRGGNTEVVIQHVDAEDGAQRFPHVDWLVVLAVIIATLLLILLCIIISRLSQPKTKYRRLHSVSSSGDGGNPAQAFTYIDLSNGEFPCSPVPGWGPPKYPNGRTRHCQKPRFAVQYQTTNVNTNAGEIDESACPRPVYGKVSNVEHQDALADDFTEGRFQPRPTPRGSSGRVPRSPERRLSREMPDPPTDFDPPGKRVRYAEFPPPPSTFESATLREAREVEIRTRYPGVNVAVSSRRLLWATRASGPAPFAGGTSSEPSLPAEDASRLPQQGTGPPPFHIPATEVPLSRMERYFAHSPFKPGVPSTGSLEDTSPEGSASAGEPSSSPPGTPDTRKSTIEAATRAKLPPRAIRLPPLTPKLRQPPRKKRSRALIRKRVTTTTPSGTRVFFPEPFSPTRHVSRTSDTVGAEKSPEPSASRRDAAHPEEVVPHPGRVEEMKRTAATLPERLPTTAVVSPRQAPTETQFAAGGSKQPFEEPAKVPSLSQAAPPGGRPSPTKMPSAAAPQWELSQTAGVRPKDALAESDSYGARDQKKPEVKPMSSQTTTMPEDAGSQGEYEGAPLPERLPTPDRPVHRPEAAVAKPTKETGSKEKLREVKIAVPTPPEERPPPVKPKRPSRTQEEPILMIGGLPARKRPRDRSSTEPFSVDDTPKGLFSPGSETFSSPFSRSSISGPSEDIPGKDMAPRAPTPPHVAPRSKSSFFATPDAADDSGPYYLQYELRPSIEYLPQQVPTATPRTSVQPEERFSETKESPAETPTLYSVPESIQEPARMPTPRKRSIDAGAKIPTPVRHDVVETHPSPMRSLPSGLPVLETQGELGSPQETGKRPPSETPQSELESPKALHEPTDYYVPLNLLPRFGDVEEQIIQPMEEPRVPLPKTRYGIPPTIPLIAEEEGPRGASVEERKSVAFPPSGPLVELPLDEGALVVQERQVVPVEKTDIIERQDGEQRLLPATDKKSVSSHTSPAPMADRPEEYAVPTPVEKTPLQEERRASLAVLGAGAITKPAPPAPPSPEGPPSAGGLSGWENIFADLDEGHEKGPPEIEKYSPLGASHARTPQEHARTPIEEQLPETEGTRTEPSEIASEEAFPEATQEPVADSTLLNLLSRLSDVETQIIRAAQEPEAPRLQESQGTSPGAAVQEGQLVVAEGTAREILEPVGEQHPAPINDQQLTPYQALPAPIAERPEQYVVPKPAEETSLQEKIPAQQLVLPSPPMQRRSAEKPRRHSEAFEGPTLPTTGRPTRKLSDDHGSTRPFTVFKAARRYSTPEIPSEALSGSRRSSTSADRSDGSPEKVAAVETQTSPYPAPRSKSSFLTPPESDSDYHYLEQELRPSIEYLLQQVPTDVPSTDTSSGDLEAGPKMAPPALSSLTGSPDPGELLNREDILSKWFSSSPESEEYPPGAPPQKGAQPRVLESSSHHLPLPEAEETGAEPPRLSSGHDTPTALHEPADEPVPIMLLSTFGDVEGQIIQPVEELQAPPPKTQYATSPTETRAVEEMGSRGGADERGLVPFLPPAPIIESYADNGTSPVQERQLVPAEATGKEIVEYPVEERHLVPADDKRLAPSRTPPGAVSERSKESIVAKRIEELKKLEPERQPTPRKRSADVKTELPTHKTRDDARADPTTGPVRLPGPGGRPVPEMPAAEREGKQGSSPESEKSSPVRTPLAQSPQSVTQTSVEERSPNQKHLPVAGGTPRESPGLVSEPKTASPLDEPTDATERSVPLNLLPRVEDVEAQIVQPMGQPEAAVEEVIVPSHQELLYPSEPGAHPTPETAENVIKDATGTTKYSLDSPRRPTMVYVPELRRTSKQWPPKDVFRKKLDPELKVWPPKPREEQDTRRSSVDESRLVPFSGRTEEDKQALVPLRLQPAPIVEKPVPEAPASADQKQLDTKPPPALPADAMASQTPVPASTEQVEVPLAHPAGVPVDETPPLAEKGLLAARKAYQESIPEITSSKLPMLSEDHPATAKRPAQIAETMSGKSPVLAEAGQLPALIEQRSEIAEITSGESALLARRDQLAGSPATGEKPSVASQGPPPQAAQPYLRQRPVVPASELIHELVESIREISTEGEYNPPLPDEAGQAQGTVPKTEREGRSAAPIQRGSVPPQGIEIEHGQHSEEPHESSGSPSESSSGTSSESEHKTLKVRKVKPHRKVVAHPLYSSSMPFEQEMQDVGDLGPEPERLELVEEDAPALQSRAPLPSPHRPSIEYVPALSLDESSSGSNADAPKLHTKDVTGPGSTTGQQSPGRKKRLRQLMSGSDIFQARLMDPDTTPTSSVVPSPYRSLRQSPEPSPPGTPHVLPHAGRTAPPKSPGHDSDLGSDTTQSGRPSEDVKAPETRSGVSKSVDEVRQPTAAVPQTSASGTTRQRMTPGSSIGTISPDLFAAQSPVTAPGSKDLITWRTPSPSGSHRPRDASNVSVLSDGTSAPAVVSPQEKAKASTGAETPGKKDK